MKRLLFLLVFAIPLAAKPVITSVSVTSGPAEGGNVVTILGTGLEGCVICSPPGPPRVRFGGVYVLDIVRYTDQLLEVVVPPHLPATVGVTVEAWDGDVTRENAYTFTGRVEDAFERVLLPILMPATQGAFNSAFHTVLRMSNHNQVRAEYVYGLLPPCDNISGCIVFDPFEHPYRLSAGGHSTTYFARDGKPGKFIYIRKPAASTVAASLRVFDVTRTAANFGTTIPVVRTGQFAPRIKLLGVPLDPRFRSTLRIYAANAVTATVSVGSERHTVVLKAGDDLFDPSYAAFSQFPIGGQPVNVTIDAPEPVWAFVTVTNNDTQLITTISPQPVKKGLAGSASR